jgi:hypothetical protein
MQDQLGQRVECRYKAFVPTLHTIEQSSGASVGTEPIVPEIGALSVMHASLSLVNPASGWQSTRTNCYLTALPLDGVANRAQNKAGPPSGRARHRLCRARSLQSAYLLEPVASDAERSAQLPASGSDLVTSWIDVPPPRPPRPGRRHSGSRQRHVRVT